jgi:hypothetical protein
LVSPGARPLRWDCFPTLFTLNSLRLLVWNYGPARKPRRTRKLLFPARVYASVSIPISILTAATRRTRTVLTIVVVMAGVTVVSRRR